MNTVTITLLSDAEIARLNAALAVHQAEQNADAQARGGTPIELALDDVAYFFLMQGLIGWERRQAGMSGLSAEQELPE